MESLSRILDAGGLSYSRVSILTGIVFVLTPASLISLDKFTLFPFIDLCLFHSPLIWNCHLEHDKLSLTNRMDHGVMSYFRPSDGTGMFVPLESLQKMTSCGISDLSSPSSRQ